MRARGSAWRLLRGWPGGGIRSGAPPGIPVACHVSPGFTPSPWTSPRRNRSRRRWRRRGPRRGASTCSSTMRAAATGGPLEHLSDAEVRDQFQLLVFGPLHLIRLLLPDLCETRGKDHQREFACGSVSHPVHGTIQRRQVRAEHSLVDSANGAQPPAGRGRRLSAGRHPHRLQRTPAKCDPVEAGVYRETLKRAFEVYDANQRRARGPEHAGESIVRLVEAKRRSPARGHGREPLPGRGCAPARAPRAHRALRWGLMRYYRLQA